MASRKLASEEQAGNSGSKDDNLGFFGSGGPHIEENLQISILAYLK
jgi:hypothetical protein